MKNINLQLSPQEVNTLLKALGDQPYVQVVNLIDKIMAQSGPQLNPKPQIQAGPEVIDSQSA